MSILGRGRTRGPTCGEGQDASSYCMLAAIDDTKVSCCCVSCVSHPDVSMVAVVSAHNQFSRCLGAV